jgi:8-oxo-dGTP diphosphatase
VCAEYLGTYSAPAANENGKMVEAELFDTMITGEIKPSAEIEEIVWVEPSQPGDLLLAPLTRDQVFRLFISRETSTI